MLGRRNGRFVFPEARFDASVATPPALEYGREGLDGAGEACIQGDGDVDGLFDSGIVRRVVCKKELAMVCETRLFHNPRHTDL